MKNQKQIVITYNPHSGKGSSKKKAEKLLNLLSEGGLASVVVLGTNSISEVYEFCASDKINIESTRALVVLGGDGTLSYWVDALIKNGKNDIPIYPIGLGTANDIASYFKTGKSVRRAADKFLGRLTLQEVAIDALKVNGERYAIYVAGSGAFTNGVSNYSKKTKRLFGKAAYAIKAFFQALRMKTQKVEFVLDGEKIILDVYFFLVQNIKRAGTMKNLSPDADPSDGMLNFIAIKKLNLFTKLRVLNLIMRGKTKTSKYFHSQPIKSMSASLVLEESKAPNRNFTATDIDGNKGDPLPLSVEVVEQKIRLIY